MPLEMLAKIISIIICLSGMGFLITGSVRLVQMNSCPVVEGKLIDIAQEYTSRGFMRKAKIAYNYEGQEYIYITSAKTFRRHVGVPIKIHVNKKGRVIELGQSIEFLVIGALMICSAIICIIVL